MKKYVGNSHWRRQGQIVRSFFTTQHRIEKIMGQAIKWPEGAKRMQNNSIKDIKSRSTQNKLLPYQEKETKCILGSPGYSKHCIDTNAYGRISKQRGPQKSNSKDNSKKKDNKRKRKRPVMCRGDRKKKCADRWRMHFWEEKTYGTKILTNFLMKGRQWQTLSCILFQISFTHTLVARLGVWNRHRSSSLSFGI